MINQSFLSLFWAAIPHQIIDYSEDSVFFVATVPLQYFLQWHLPENFVQPLMQGQFLTDEHCAERKFDDNLFEQWESDLQRNDPDLHKPVLLEMQARLSRLALTSPPPREATHQSVITYQP